MPANPTSLENLQEIAATFRTTLTGDSFLMYDSYEEEDEDYDGGRIIIFGTRENLQNLCRSPTWFVDGTFKCAPSIFFQLKSVQTFTEDGASTGLHE